MTLSFAFFSLFVTFFTIWKKREKTQDVVSLEKINHKKLYFCGVEKIVEITKIFVKNVEF